MDHEFVDQGTTLRDLKLGESMHSSIGAWLEANTIYIEQAELPRRCAPRNDADITPITIYDLGLGIAANALAAIVAHRALPQPKRPLRIESFESMPSGLAHALKAGSQHFPFLAGHEVALATLLAHGDWRSEDKQVEWFLHVGDFENLSLARLWPAELIFFDFYSPQATPSLWRPEIFGRLKEKCPESLLITYSAATRIRAAILLGGWWVGEGVGTPLKRQTTLATFNGDSLKRPLEATWLQKFARSQAKTPHGYILGEAALMKALESHPQFTCS